MAKMKLPFTLERNNGEAVTDASEIDVSAGGESPADAQTAIVGTLADTIPENENDLKYLPANGGNYFLGSIGDLGFSNEMEAMTLGCTVTFAATQDFPIVLPHVIKDDGTVLSSPTHKAFIAGAETLECESGKAYVLTITAVNGGTDSNDSSRLYYNIFSMAELAEPEEEDEALVI